MGFWDTVADEGFDPLRTSDLVLPPSLPRAVLSDLLFTAIAFSSQG
jgi:hypothetical protein